MPPTILPRLSPLDCCHQCWTDQTTWSSRLQVSRPPTFLASAPTAVPRPPHQRSLVAEGQDERPTLSPDSVLPPRLSGKAIKRLPKASRECAARKFAEILGAVVDKNDHTSWTHLLHFSSRCLGHPERGGGRQLLATAVNRQIREEVDPPPTVSPNPVMKLASTFRRSGRSIGSTCVGEA